MRPLRPVRVRSLVIGEGRPALIVPLTGADEPALLHEAQALAGSAADLAEWRVDHLESAAAAGAPSRDGSPAGGRLAGGLGAIVSEAVRMAARLRTALGEMPLLITVRTAQEGGQWDLADPQYEEVLGALIRSGAADALDVEARRDPGTVRALIAQAHAAGIPVIGSAHDFESTPPREELVALLRRIQDLGADIPKAAVMPRSPGDVLALLEATWEMRSRHAEGPIITMSMGPLGAVTRISGEIFGSAATFAAQQSASAPGQLPLEEMPALLRALAP